MKKIDKAKISTILAKTSAENDENSTETSQEENLISEASQFQQERQSRKIGLFGELDGEKAELTVFNLMFLHETRFKKMPRPLTAAQKKKFIKASREGDEKTIESFKIKFDEVSQPIELILSTPGGRASDMFCIYDTMRMIREDCEIHTLGLGHVMSAGTLLLASGTKGKRKIGKNCRVMVHQAMAGTSGSHHEMINEMVEIEKTQSAYIRCLSAETKMTESFIRKLMEKKVNIYMSAEEAIKNGLADIIV